MKLSTEEFIERAKQAHGNKYDYSLVEYIATHKKIIICCCEHGEFLQRADSHLRGSGCPGCASTQGTTEEFIQKAKEIHGDYYDYSLVEYTKNKNKVKIICPIHDEFEQTPDSHKRGSGCPKCATQQRTTEEFIQCAKEIHGDYYDYSLVEYTGSFIKIKIICPIHNKFLQNPSQHLNGNGCPECGRERIKLTTPEFIQRASEIHNNEYDYSKTIYEDIFKKVIIICRKHGEFIQTANDHLCACGCPECQNNSISKEETKWLDSLNIPKSLRNNYMYAGNRRIKPDAFDPITNTVYEYWGDFWHGNLNKFKAEDINPKNKFTYGELNRITQEKRKLILENGYNLIEIWSSEWKKIEKQNKKLSIRS